MIEQPDLVPYSGDANLEIDVSIVWNHKKITIKCQQGTPYQQLLPRALARFNKYFLESRIDKQSEEVIGFSHKPIEFTLDYQLSIGEGAIYKQATLTPFFKNNETGILKYQVYKCLAVGGFSKVYLVRSHHDAQFYVMKTMARTKGQNDDQDPDISVIENEKNINMMVGEHPFIVKLHDSFETDNFSCFIFEYCPGGQLFYNLKKIKRMTEEQARFYFVQILYAFDHLHQNGILYRDLKPENILIGADGHVKLADFGLSKTGMDNDALSYSYCGSAEYMAPEMILRTGHSFSFDFYTLGAMLYELIVGVPPFYSQNEDANRFGILNEEVIFPSEIYMSSDLKNILKGLLNKNPKLRLGCLKGVKEIRFHPWVGMFSAKSILDKKLIPPFLPSLQNLNFDESQIGKDEGQFTRKLRKQIESINHSIDNKKQSRHKLFVTRSQIKHSTFEPKQSATLSRHTSPYLQKMALTSTAKLKLLRNLEPISKKKQRLCDTREHQRVPDENKQNKTFQLSKLTRVYIANMNKRKDQSPKYKNTQMNRNVANIRKLIKIVPNTEVKCSSVWK